MSPPFDPTPEELEDYAKRACRGDADAKWVVFRHLIPYLVAHAGFQLRGTTHVDPHSVVSDVMADVVSVLESKVTYPNETWLGAIMRFLARRIAYRVLEILRETARTEPFDEAKVPAPPASPADPDLAKSINEVVTKLGMLLSSDELELFHLKLIRHLSYEEVKEVAESPVVKAASVSNLAQKLRRIKKRLRNSLKDPWLD